MQTFKIAVLSFLTISLAGCGLASEPLVTTPAPTSIPTPTQSPTVEENRPALSMEDLNKQISQERCRELVDAQQGMAQSEVEYKDEALGFSAMLPYSEVWGTKEHKVVPYEILTVENGVSTSLKHIAFGPARLFGEGGCGYVRDYRIEVRTKRDKAKVVKDMVSENMISSEADIISMSTEQFGGKTVLKYQTPGLCDDTYYEVLGEKNNYIVHTFCTYKEEDQTTLQKVISSIKFI